MIALDTNVLVRFLVADDAHQHRQTVAFIERALSEASTLRPAHPSGGLSFDRR